MTLIQKKKVMTALRVGVIPKYGRRLKKKEALYRQHTDIVRLLDTTGYPTQDVSMHDVWYLLAPLLGSPTRRSILSVALRCAHLLEGEASQAVEEGISKELCVTQRDDLIPSLQYPFFHSREAALSIPIHPSLPFRPLLQLSLRHRFIHLQRRLSTGLLVPRTTHKTCGQETASRFWEQVYPYLKSWERPVYNITTTDLERLYLEDGIEVEGPCEVRYAWKYNDLKPRVYYAIGATAYNAAKYVHAVFDQLVKISRSTDPRSRYSFAGFPLLSFPDNSFIIYDYTSFTSRLVDFKRFCAEFASFMIGTKVKIYDTRFGIKEVDLGTLLHTYNDTCNTNGEFSLTRLTYPEDRLPPEHVILEHKVAGMLGVFGNIVGSTALHGIVGIQICGGDDNGNFIGDDAGIVNLEMESFEIYQVKDAIRTIGDIAEEKFEIFEENAESYDDDDSWHYTKRPIVVKEGGISQSWMPEFPLLAPARGLRLDHCTVPLESFRIRRRVFVRQVTRFLNSLHMHKEQVDEADWDLVQFILRESYAKLQLPVFGAVPRLENRWIEGRPHGDDLVVVPPITEDVLEKGWRKVLHERMEITGGTIRIPKFEEEDDLPRILAEGLVFVHRSDRVLSLLSKLGVVEKRSLYEDRLATEESLERYFDFLDGNLKPLYEYQVLSDYDPWSSYFDLLYH
jgi:hypothetical protein